MAESPPVILWFRRDLRLSDNPALTKAVASGAAVIPLYLHDETGEGRWATGAASRWWLHHSLTALGDALAKLGSRLVVRSGSAERVLHDVCQATGASEVYWNRRYEPAIVERDTSLKKSLAERGAHGRSFNGALLQSPLTLSNASGAPYKVFTPFWKALRKAGVRAVERTPKAIPSPRTFPEGQLIASLRLLPRIPWDAGFYEAWKPGSKEAERKLERFGKNSVSRYDEARDLPAASGVSRLSPHLHFGELSPAQIWDRLDGAAHEAYLRQIAWREFGYHLLYHFPDTPERPLRREFEAFPWRENESEWEAWTRGLTGYPIVDAGMRELWRTGWMHNRVRMVAASFLVKHLLQPWQRGAEWFWDTLVDADLANNTLGWQWVAGCGADAAPFFRIFNPVAQGERFDPRGEYTRQWLPELAGLPDKYLFKPWEAPPEVVEAAGVRLGRDYPLPIVDHKFARERALEAYRTLKQS